jgi:hypothetical protein
VSKIQRKPDIREFLEDAKRNWEDKYAKYYYHRATPDDERLDDQAKFALSHKGSPIFDPIIIGWTEGIIDALEWVLGIPETESILKDIHIKEKYRAKLETFNHSIE